ncbi:MAG: beta-ketoacyl-ACP reductase, partial [Paraburkholderia tropica]
MDAERIAFVTGGMGGLGAAISRSLAAAGFKVAVSCSKG